MANLIYVIHFVRLRLPIMLGLMLLVSSFSLYAARFGPMQVFSHKGEPLRAKIEILDVPQDEQGWLTLRSAPQYVYTNAALRFTNAAKEMKATIERSKDGKIIAWLTTYTPVDEEFIDLLLTLSWSTGQMTEAFTLLIPHQTAQDNAREQIVPPVTLDPLPSAATNTQPPSTEISPSTGPVLPSANNAMPAPEPGGFIVQPPGQVSSNNADRPAITTEPAPADDKKLMAPAENTKTNTQAAKTDHGTRQKYKVRRGDTLSKIAQRIKQTEPETVTLDQLLWGIYQNNPEAFMEKNMNRLKAGVTLDLPTIEETEQIDNTAARRQVSIQAGEFERYRASLATAASTSRADTSARSSSGQISTVVKDNVADQPENKLQLSRSDSPVQSKEEQKIAEQRAVREEQERVMQLEKQVANLQKLTDLTHQAPTQANSTDKGVPVATAQKPIAGVVQTGIQKIQSFFARNPAVPLSILLLLLVFGAFLLRRRVKPVPLFQRASRQSNIPPAAQKVFTDLSLDLEPVQNPKGTVPIDKRVTQQVDTMTTRLELAQAYWDLGDKQGAQQLLEEVIAQGNEAQRKQAQALLSNLT